VVCFGCFICGIVECEDWYKKYVVLVRICCGLTELKWFGENAGCFNRRLLGNFMIGFLVFVCSGLRCYGVMVFLKLCY
jgi:hypothetical protein